MSRGTVHDRIDFLQAHFKQSVRSYGALIEDDVLPLLAANSTKTKTRKEVKDNKEIEI